MSRNVYENLKRNVDDGRDDLRIGNEIVEVIEENIQTT